MNVNFSLASNIFALVLNAGDESFSKEAGKREMCRQLMTCHEIKVIRRFIFIKARNALYMTEIRIEHSHLSLFANGSWGV